MTTPSGPLAGIRVLDLTRLLPGAFATALLADLGADVIKIEQPGSGDPMRGYEPKIGDSSAFTWVTDRNKRSVELNLREDPEALLKLVETADALVESFRPGVMERLGLGYETLAAVNPKLVYVSISGYGADGPRAKEAGHDINYLGRAGVLSTTPARDLRACRSPTSPAARSSASPACSRRSSARSARARATTSTSP